MFPPLLAALAMSKEGEQKTILQVYVSSIPAARVPARKDIRVHGRCALRMVAVASSCCSPISVCILPATRRLLIAASVLYAFCVATFGTLIGSAIPNQAAAIQAVALGGFLLVFLLSGLDFPG